MEKRGARPKGKVNIVWSSNFAYAIGLLVSDGCVSNSGRHITFVSKDIEQIKNYMKCLAINVHIGTTTSGYKNVKAFRVQFGDVLFHSFLRNIGVHPAKSKTVGKVAIPKEYFFDFLRGSYDGDGCFYSYWDPRWRSSHMFYLTFSSASLIHVQWLREEIEQRLAVKGHISKSKNSRSIYNLRYAKKEALEIIQKMYYSPSTVYLSRKRMKIEKALAVEQKQQNVYNIYK